MSNDILILDTETTGLLAPSAAEIQLQPFITEIYIVRLNEDWEIVSEFETFMKPPIPIPEIVTKITGIDDNMVKNAPEFIEVVDDIIDIFHGSKVMVAHNLPFDHGVIKYELMRHGLEFKFPWCPVNHCTIELSQSIRNKPLKLDILYEIAFGKPRTLGSHRARKDVVDTAKCYKWLIENGFVS